MEAHFHPRAAGVGPESALTRVPGRRPCPGGGSRHRSPQPLDTLLAKDGKNPGGLRVPGEGAPRGPRAPTALGRPCPCPRQRPVTYQAVGGRRDAGAGATLRGGAGVHRPTDRGRASSGERLRADCGLPAAGPRAPGPIAQLGHPRGERGRASADPAGPAASGPPRRTHGLPPGPPPANGSSCFQAFDGSFREHRYRLGPPRPSILQMRKLSLRKAE